MTTFDAQCSICGQGESKHVPQIVGEDRNVLPVCPPSAFDAWYDAQGWPPNEVHHACARAAWNARP